MKNDDLFKAIEACPGLPTSALSVIIGNSPKRTNYRIRQLITYNAIEVVMVENLTPGAHKLVRTYYPLNLIF